MQQAAAPNSHGDEKTFNLRRSGDRFEKEKEIFERFASRIEQELNTIHASCEKKMQSAAKIVERVGRFKWAHRRAARLFDLKIDEGEDDRTKFRTRSKMTCPF